MMMKSEEKKIASLYKKLSEGDRQSLMAFAEFLNSRMAVVDEPLGEPLNIVATENESVVGALKRLAKMYPMLDKSKMLNDTSVLVSQHVIQGREKTEVIKELEEMFNEHYQRLRGDIKA
ncbi:MAG: Crp/Fnr family transcriptional regulator [Gammaproteobacteria bacterium]|nr:Crp/Fnr family transcriptional regulator [Gammaproteobacteria bacterium]